ncbi:MAG: tetratricopeptide repeat protein [Leptolyngbyaceae cyanobacterium]
MQPDNSSTLYNKGRVLADLERYEEAITAYEATLKIQPEDLEAL